VIDNTIITDSVGFVKRLGTIPLGFIPGDANVPGRTPGREPVQNPEIKKAPFIPVFLPKFIDNPRRVWYNGAEPHQTLQRKKFPL
jgi:hypothetical protein